MMRGKFSTMNEYIQATPRRVQPLMRKIRDVVQRTVPNALPIISYQMPAFRYNKRILVYFAACKHHIGMYPPAPKGLKKETAKYAGPKGNLRFMLDEPVPFMLIKRIVKLRAKELKEKK